jgi:hypothetical protein
VKIQGDPAKKRTSELTVDDEASAKLWGEILANAASKSGVVEHKNADRGAALYTDDCCELYADCLIVKWYFFPGGAKTVPIRYVRHSSCALWGCVGLA